MAKPDIQSSLGWYKNMKWIPLSHDDIEWSLIPIFGLNQALYSAVCQVVNSYLSDFHTGEPTKSNENSTRQNKYQLFPTSKRI